MPESNKDKVVHLTAFGHALAGALGGVFSNAVVYPLDTAKTHIQAGSRRHDNRSILKLLLSIMKEEGFFGFYKGFSTSMVSVFTQQYAYFFFYTLVRQTYLRRLERISKSSKVFISTGVELLLGAIAGVLAQLCTTPISVIATRQQIGHSKESTTEPSSTKRKNDSFIEVGRQIVQEHGVGGLWLGIKPSLVLTVNPAITYGVFERVKGVLLGGDTDTKLSPGVAFMLGAFSKSLATIVTYPYIMAKVRVQTSIKDENSPEELEEGKGKGKAKEGTVHRSKYSGSVDVLKKVWKSEGFLGWYQGMGAQILKAVLTQALLFVSKDQFERYALVILTPIGQFRIPVASEATVSLLLFRRLPMGFSSPLFPLFIFIMTDATPIGTTQGILHVLVDIGPKVSEEEFHQWYNNLHGPSRIAIEGVKRGVRYEALDGLAPKWLANYEIDDLNVLETEPYLSLRSNPSPEDADVLKRLSLIDRKVYADVLHRGQFQPVVGTILIAVWLLIPSANAKELEEWYSKEHVDMLADIPGWFRSRLFKELSSESSQTDLIQYMALHEYHPDNGLGGPKHVAASSTDWRMRIMSLAIGGPKRRDFKLYHIF